MRSESLVHRTIVHFNTRTLVVMSDLRKIYHSSIIDLNRSHYWWSAGKQAQCGSITIAILLTESKT